MTSWKKTLKTSIGIPLFLLWLAAAKGYAWFLQRRIHALRAENEYLRKPDPRDADV